MSSSDTTIVMVIFAAVAIFIVAVFWMAFAIRGRRKRQHLAGPGTPDVPPAAEPWRRFATALAAPYARFEWAVTKGRRSRQTPEQTYFGYGVSQPWGVVGQALANDWGVRRTDQAVGAVQRATDSAALAVRAIAVADPRTDPAMLRDRLMRAGAPRGVIDGIGPEQIAHIRAAEGPAAAGIHDLEAAKNELAFDIGRFANLTRWTAYMGFIDRQAADASGDVYASAAAIAFGSWNEYADRYLAGLYASKFSADRQRTGSIDWLKSDPASPWRQANWPR